MMAIILLFSAALHRLMQNAAPSNRLMARISGSRRQWRAASLAGLACVAYGGIAFFGSAVLRAGGPEWVNLVVAASLWNAMKLGWLALSPVRSSRSSTVGGLR